MRPRLILIAILSTSPLGLLSQSHDIDWFTASFLGTLWRSELPMTVGDSSFVEPALRPLLPSQALEDLRFSRHPYGPEIAQRLAISAGLFDLIVHRPTDPITTDSLLSLLKIAEPHSIDLKAYMRLRLFDHLIGDWSRTPADIEWHPLFLSEGTVWKPAPARFRNAFAKYDGLLPRILLRIADHMTSWSADPTTSLRENNPLRTLDRRILSSAPWADWDTVASDLTHRLSPDVIDDACTVIDGPVDDGIASPFKDRVKLLPVLAQQYYRSITRFVEFHSGGGQDSVFVKVRSKRALEVSLSGDLNASRLLNSLATKEIRFLMPEGSNTLLMEGPDNLEFDVVVDVGDGGSVVRNRQNSLQAWNNGAPGSVTFFATPEAERARLRDDAWGRRIVFVPWVDANRDDYLFFGGGPEITSSAYMAFPYATRTSVLAGYATRTKRIRFEGSYETRTLLRGAGIGITARYSQLDISNFYGIGNETSSSTDLMARSFFKADQRVFELSASARVFLSEALSVGFSPTVRFLRTDPRPGSLIDSLISSGYARRLNYARFGFSALFDSRDHSVIPTRGMFGSAEIMIFPEALQNRNSFASVTLESRYYHFLGREGMHILLRSSGQAILGDHPWFESAFLGGSRSLRGYERQRFAGDASLSGALEWRAPLGRLHILWPFDTGGIIFAETGRVFSKGEVSGRWHSAGGLGAWFRPARSPYTIVISVAVSPELTEFLATFGIPVQ